MKMKENMDKLEEETNEYVEKKIVKKKEGKKMNKEVVKKIGESNIVHETGSSIRKKKKNKENKIEEVSGNFIDCGESNKSETSEKERMMEMGIGKKKKKKKESESNEMYKVLFEGKESEEIKTLQRECRIETSNSWKKAKKKKQSELEEVHKELVEGEDSTKTAILEKESMIELNKDKKKKKCKKKENASENVNKKVIIGEEFEGNSKCREISTMEDDTMIEPENNDKIKKKQNEEDTELLDENEARISEVIIDTSNGERNKKWKKNMEDNKESNIDEELRSSSTQSINRETVDKKREKKNKKLDDKVSHLDKATESSVKNKKNKLPHLDEEQKSSSTKKKRETIGDSEAVESSSTRKKKRKLGDGTEGESGNKKKSKKDNEKNDVAEKDAQKAKNKKINDRSPNSEPKRVSFSSNVEVFPINNDDSTEKVYYEKNGDGSIENIYNEKNNFGGKRFSPYEDQLIKDAIQKYIDKSQLGVDAVQKIINCNRNPEVKNCWKEIAKDLPWRKGFSVYCRGRLLLQMSEYDEKRGFSEEEIKRIMDFHAENGPKWTQLSKELKRSALHIKDTYRRKRLKEASKGKWTQEEYQKLFDLVHENICAKIHENTKINKNPMIRDGISWEAISEKMKTRAMAYCCCKWYDSLASPLVREKKWSDPDDYRLLDALYHQEECCEEDVDWDNLVESRPGEYCLKRWHEMVRHTGEYKERSFRDQINLLKERYDVSMLKYVEALKNKNRREEREADEENDDEENDDEENEE